MKQQTWGEYAATVQKLANEFDALIKTDLGEVDYAAAIAANATEANANICHTHDYCDANVTMAAAFEHAMGRATDLQSDYDVQLWDDAWSQWKSDRKRGAK